MNMNVSLTLTEELSEFVKAKVSSGRYTSASEVVREALRIMEQTEEARLAFMWNAWAAGQASGDAGPADFAGIKAHGRGAVEGGRQITWERFAFPGARGAVSWKSGFTLRPTKARRWLAPLA